MVPRLLCVLAAAAAPSCLLCARAASDLGSRGCRRGLRAGQALCGLSVKRQPHKHREGGTRTRATWATHSARGPSKARARCVATKMGFVLTARRCAYYINLITNL